MSLKDMIGQMSQIDVHNIIKEDEKGNKVVDDEELERWVGEIGVGSILNSVDGSNWGVAEYRRMIIRIQKVAEAHNRPPVLYGIDSVHGGNYFHGEAVTPQPINIAATFNRSVAHIAGELASQQTRLAGISWLFSPLLGIALKPKWSRVYETFGEDPYLVGEMASEMIKGIQAVDDSGLIPSRAAACGKHFIGYSAPRTGHDRAPSWIPTRHLYQYFVPPWEKAISEANVLTVMESYTETDGVPNVASAATTQYLLRQRLKFEGLLVTDYNEIENLFSWHKTASSILEAVRQSMAKSSVDMSMLPDNYDNFCSSIIDAVSAGDLELERVRASAERVMQLKTTLRMMDEKLTTSPTDSMTDHFAKHNRIVADMTRQSIVLAENREKTLPLVRTQSPALKILVTGPTAKSMSYQTGGWTGHWQGMAIEEETSWFTFGSTLIDAMQNRTGWEVTYSCGVDILGNSCNDSEDSDTDNEKESLFNEVVEDVSDFIGIGDKDGNASSVERTVEVAKGQDIVVVALGEETYAEKPGDILSLSLPQGQYDLVRKVSRETDAKVILVYFGGRPRLLSPVVDEVDAVVIALLPGPSAGEHVASIIDGNVNPSARLPITYPRSNDGGDHPYFRPVSDQCTKGAGALPHWEYARCDSQWLFGHGMSYTQFDYSDLSFSVNGNNLALTVVVTNVGDVAGAEVVMFFVFEDHRPTTPEYKRLLGFDKTFLKPGSSSTVAVSVPLEALRFVGPNDDEHYVSHAAQAFSIGVGYRTDCRNPSDDNRQLCVRVKDVLPNYNACEAACDLWISSGCADEFPLQACLNACHGVSAEATSLLDRTREGWGWNYVRCLESVVHGMQRRSKEDCWMMTKLCRDVFTTGTLDEFGYGRSEHDIVPSTLPKYLERPAYAFASSVGLLATILLYKMMNGSDRWFKGEQTRYASVDASDLQLT